VFECVINISEGRELSILDELSAVAGPSLRDRHHDVFHHRSVFTLIDEPDELVRGVHAIIRHAYLRLDLRTHVGVHPRFGVVDVVPFVALDPARSHEACRLRDETAAWLSSNFSVPVFLYGAMDDGTIRTLPEVRRRAFATLAPDQGPDLAPETLGAVAVGCRAILVAWNVWLRGVDLADARRIAAALRRPSVRALAFKVGDDVQVSCNLVDVHAVRVSDLYDEVVSMIANGSVLKCELVGLAPRSLLDADDPERWTQLGLSGEATIEARIAG